MRRLAAALAVFALSISTSAIVAAPAYAAEWKACNYHPTQAA